MEEFATKDFAQGAILLASGLKLIRLESGNHKFLSFIFQDDNFIAEDLIEKYWQGELLIDAKTLIESVNVLKNRIYATKGM